MRDVIDTVLRSPKEDVKWFVKQFISFYTISGFNEINEELFSIEKLLNLSTDPIKIIRSKIMDAVSSSILNAKVLEYTDEKIESLCQHIFKSTKDKAGFHACYLQAEFKVICLRQYAWLKYRDGGPKDWFSLWTEAEQIRTSAEISAFLIKLGQEGGNIDLHKIILKTYQDTTPELRRNLLASPTGAVFTAPFDS
jgi:hypothetical protein